MTSMASAVSSHVGHLPYRVAVRPARTHPRVSGASGVPPLLAAPRIRSGPVRTSAFNPRADETPDEAIDRRMRETEEVDRKSQTVTSLAELDAFLTEAGDKLVFLTVESTEECDLSDFPDPQDIQRTVSDNRMNPCLRVQHTLARVARECDDAVFLTLEVSDDTPELVAMARELGVTRFPTFQYYKNSELVWEHYGAGQFTNQAIGEGMLFYGDQASEGLHASDYITDISSETELENFMELCALPQTSALGVELDVPCDKQLAVVNVSLNKGSPGCLHIYPAVLALAKNTAGACRWARVIGDASPEAAEFVKTFKADQVPAFIFYESNREVGRYYGSDRLELMNKVIEIQQAEGIRMPDRQPRKRIPVSEAKRIAKEARARNKQSQWTM